MDDVDKATDLEEARTQAAMARIASQLKMVNTNIFCEDCDNEIPEKRRIAMPAATRCISCQETHDKEFKGVRRL